MHNSTVVRIVPPSSLPLTLEEVKAHLRVDHSAEDALISQYIAAVTGQLDGPSGGLLDRALLTQTLEWRLATFPSTDWQRELRVPFPPLQSVTAITYIDTDEVEQTVDPSAYTVDTASRPGRIVPVANAPWPATATTMWQAVSIRYVAGYGTAVQVPPPLKQYMLLQIGSLFAIREAVVAGSNQIVPTAVPGFGAQMLNEFRWGTA